MDVFGLIDRNCLPFFLVVNAFGIAYKEWMPKHRWVQNLKDTVPIPVVVTIVSVLLCSLVGFLAGIAEGVEWIPFELYKYGFGNGLAIAFLAIAVYDTGKGFKKSFSKGKEVKNEKASEK